eukprot:6487301-Amphidinium_carterae.5
MPTARKGPARFRLTQLKKFAMENGSVQTIIHVVNEPAILHTAQEAARELTIPWRHSSSHSHQGQGAVEVLNGFTRHSLHNAERSGSTWLRGTIYNHQTMFLKHFSLTFYNMLASQSIGTWYMLTV